LSWQNGCNGRGQAKLEAKAQPSSAPVINSLMRPRAEANNAQSQRREHSDIKQCVKARPNFVSKQRLRSWLGARAKLPKTSNPDPQNGKRAKTGSR